MDLETDVPFIQSVKIAFYSMNVCMCVCAAHAWVCGINC